MNEIHFSTGFKRALKRYARNHPQLYERVEQTLIQLRNDHTHPSLRTHKLSGELGSRWSCSVAYDLRIIFRIERNEKTNKIQLVLLTLGTHDEVY